ncbi:hypothetical protein [Chryseobacterium indoltheticum]|uniref:hypothetical protein n=1 Tax=Chryseobacterium indoltheticum TaxID=254 RepID=UPI003F496102
MMFLGESIANKLFNEKESYDYKCLLAEAYARILDDKNIDAAIAIIENTKNRIEKQGKEILKQNYIVVSLLFTLIICLFLIIFVFIKPFLGEYINESKYQVIITSLFGGVGAFVFTIIRLKTHNLPEVVISKTSSQI